jgi:hypothetical protein
VGSKQAVGDSNNTNNKQPPYYYREPGDARIIKRERARKREANDGKLESPKLLRHAR